MKKQLFTLTTLVCGLLVSSLAFGNPAMLPKHPGYPMSADKDPVKGERVTYDAGEKQLPPQEALKEASKFDETRAINIPRDVLPNVIYPKTSNR